MTIVEGWLVMYPLGVFSGAALAWVSLPLMHRKRKLAQTVAATDRAKPEKYGHPLDPVAEVKKRLVPPPAGFMWELYVDRRAGSTDPYLNLELVDLVTGAAVDKREANLERRRQYGRQESWSTYYERYSYITKKTMRDEFVLPIADWARSVASKHGDGGGVSYHEVIA